MAPTDGFVDALLEAPIGCALLARVESRTRFPDGWAPIEDSSAAGVQAAVGLIETMSLGEFIELVINTADLDLGPWTVGSPGVAATAYTGAAARTPIAEAIDRRFGKVLHEPLVPEAQQWWTNNGIANRRLAPLFRDFEHVYDAGQFTWAGLWTVSDPPTVVHEHLIDAWEMLFDGPVTRWSLPARSDVRVFEVNRPGDWVDLITEHPRTATSSGGTWHLPGHNQDPSALGELMEVPGQRAARTSIRSHHVPDWRSVTQKYDGVHLTWAGLITAEGCITDLGGGDVAMLRFWFSERTLWLADVFAQPVPLDPPVISAGRRINGRPAAIVADEIDSRRDRDRAGLADLLGRGRWLSIGPERSRRRRST